MAPSPAPDKQIVTLLEERIAGGGMSAASVIVAKDGDCLLEWSAGTTKFGKLGDPVTSEHVFYLTSITKALAFTAAATLLQEGSIDLQDPVYLYLPPLDTPEKRNIKLLHLFTHTSGLPEFAPNDHDLRRSHAPLSEFITAAIRAPLGFQPGTAFQYSNLGTHLMSSVVETVLSMSMPKVLEERVFGPLGMSSSFLGWREEFQDKFVDAKSLDPSDWDHNSVYWREIGAPWAGAHSTATDLQLLLSACMDGGISSSGEQVLTDSAISLFDAMDLAPASAEDGRRWALGWQVQTSFRNSGFGDRVPPGAFGHTGAAGTLMWCDRRSRVSFVLLTNGRRSGIGNEDQALQSCSNLAASWLI